MDEIFLCFFHQYLKIGHFPPYILTKSIKMSNHKGNFEYSHMPSTPSFYRDALLFYLKINVVVLSGVLTCMSGSRDNSGSSLPFLLDRSQLMLHLKLWIKRIILKTNIQQRRENTKIKIKMLSIIFRDTEML